VHHLELGDIGVEVDDPEADSRSSSATAPVWSATTGTTTAATTASAAGATNR
jgi:hypothetical protein